MLSLLIVRIEYFDRIADRYMVGTDRHPTMWGQMRKCLAGRNLTLHELADTYKKPYRSATVKSELGEFRVPVFHLKLSLFV